jgi:hypothetical protein
MPGTKEGDPAFMPAEATRLAAAAAEIRERNSLRPVLQLFFFWFFIVFA